jgi:hypothetical protein
MKPWVQISVQPKKRGWGQSIDYFSEDKWPTDM